jgi:hypothetical protein
MDGDLTPHPYCHWPRRYTRSIYQPETWGSVCERGVPYRDAGAPAPAGTRGQVHKISTGRKARGMASDGVRDALNQP